MTLTLTSSTVDLTKALNAQVSQFMTSVIRLLNGEAWTPSVDTAWFLEGIALVTDAMAESFAPYSYELEACGPETAAENLGERIQEDVNSHADAFRFQVSFAEEMREAVVNGHLAAHELVETLRSMRAALNAIHDALDIASEDPGTLKSLVDRLMRLRSFKSLLKVAEDVSPPCQGRHLRLVR